jgi:alkanesulfonate monooxygenase SsuD/methylene tetrahydromethanopterin reductase-like flavin-dependent oxidoreductase (luciferase family)
LQLVCPLLRGETVTYQGRHYQIEGARLPLPAVQQPSVPILIGGGGEQKTLRLVAKYAQACNLFAGAEVPHKLEVLRAHCEAEGRSYDDIEKTVLYNFDVGEHGENVERIVNDLRGLSELGFTLAHGQVANVSSLRPLEVIGKEVVPAVAAW